MPPVPAARRPRLPAAVLFLGLAAAAASAHGNGPAPAPAPSDSLVVLVADAWPPYNGAAGDSLEGYMIDVARAVYEPLGWRVDYRIVPWRRALAGVAAGTWDGAVGATALEAEGLVMPRTTLLLSRNTFYVRAGDPWRYGGPASLAKVCLGASQGYDYASWLNDYIEQHADDPARIQMIAGDFPVRQNLRKLLAGRVDVVVGDPGTVTYTARVMGLDGRIEPAGRTGGAIPCSIAFAPTARGRRLADLLDRGVARLRRDGEFAAILARYGLRDWAPREDRR